MVWTKLVFFFILLTPFIILDIAMARALIPAFNYVIIFTDYLCSNGPFSLSIVSSSMTELEKDIGSLRSGLKSVEAVSELRSVLENICEMWIQAKNVTFLISMSLDDCLRPRLMCVCLFPGAAVPAGSVLSESCR